MVPLTVSQNSTLYDKRLQEMQVLKQIRHLLMWHWLKGAAYLQVMWLHYKILVTKTVAHAKAN